MLCQAHTPPRRTYRHGDVPAAAIAAALRHVDAHGSADFTLRGLAKELGIAHPSLYNHFASREALVDAIAIAGFEELLTRQHAVVAREGDPLQACLALCRDLVAFATAQPALYRIMFGRDVIRRKVPGSPLAMATEAPLELAGRVVAAAQAAGQLRCGDARMLAAAMWASAHGVAQLAIDERLGMLGAGSLGTLVDITLTAISDGLAPIGDVT